MWLEGERWQEFFHSFRRSAFRLETLPAYAVSQEDEEFRRFRAGEKRPDEEFDSDEWLVKVSEHVEAGREMSRVHTLTSPLSEYLRFEFEWFYPFSVRAGEDVRILDFAATPDPGLPRQDFWLFDDEKVVLMHYAEDGTQTGRELLESADPTPYVEYKHLALQHSVPFTEYTRLH